MNRLIVMSVLWIFGAPCLHSTTLDITKVYKLKHESRVFRSCHYVASLVLDLSDHNLSCIDDIDLLLVKYKDKIFSILLVDRLTIILKNNKLKKLPYGLAKLNAAWIDVRGNEGLVVDEYLKQQMKDCYFYESVKKQLE